MDEIPLNVWRLLVFSALLVQFSNARVTKSSDVIFPDDSAENPTQAAKYRVIELIHQVLEPYAPQQCGNGQIFCEFAPSYPYRHLKKILEGNGIYKQLFGNDDDQLSGRTVDEDDFICRSVVRTLFPKIGRNKYNEWRYIVNQDEFVQSIRIETCRRSGGPCDIIGDQLPMGYTTSCRQKYVYTRLLSVDDRGIPVTDIFPLPSACCCSYRRTFKFFARISPK